MNTARRKVGWIMIWNTSISKLPHAGVNIRSTSVLLPKYATGKRSERTGTFGNNCIGFCRYCIKDGEQFINSDWWFGTFSRFFGFYNFFLVCYLWWIFFTGVKDRKVICRSSFFCYNLFQVVISRNKGNAK